MMDTQRMYIVQFRLFRSLVHIFRHPVFRHYIRAPVIVCRCHMWLSMMTMFPMVTIVDRLNERYIR